MLGTVLTVSFTYYFDVLVPYLLCWSHYAQYTVVFWLKKHFLDKTVASG